MRRATITRKTAETDITVSVDLDGSGRSSFDTGVPFLEHMLDQVARHGLVDIEIRASGDTHIDDHHTVEDIGISLGQAFARAVGDKKGIYRYGHAYVPLDEALSRVVVDFSGRPGLEFNVEFPRARIGAFDVDLFIEFFQGAVLERLGSRYSQVLQKFLETTDFFLEESHRGLADFQRADFRIQVVTLARENPVQLGKLGRHAFSIGVQQRNQALVLFDGVVEFDTADLGRHRGR